MPFAEDLTAFFNTDEFAVQTTLAGVAVCGIFDSAYLLEDMSSGVAAFAPVLTLASADVPASPAGALVVVGGVTYKVAEAMPDGTGVTRLRLRI